MSVPSRPSSLFTSASRPVSLFILSLTLLAGCIPPPGYQPLASPSPSVTPTPEPTPSPVESLSKISTLAGENAGGGDGNLKTASFSQPVDLAMDKQGLLYVSSEHKIRRIGPKDSVSTIAGGPEGYLDTFRTSARFSHPRALAFDSQGNLLIVDTGNHAIRKLSPQGQVTTLAGGTAGYADGPLVAARFFNPKGLAIDAQDNLYVSEGGLITDGGIKRFHIRKITPAGWVSTLAGASEGQADGPGATAAFLRPEGLAVDTQGNVYVADAGNHRIRRVAPDGTVSTFAGSVQGHVDGVGSAARFNGPTELELDPVTGYLYVSEFDGNRLRLLTPGASASTIISSMAGFADGPLASSRLNGPLGLILSREGALLFCDSLNHRLRMID